jgi:MYXO-CTERM domain-containing protein
VSTNICLWCSALVLALERPVAPPRGLVAIVAVSACTTVLVRGLSPLWVAMTGLSVLALAERQAVLALVRRRSVQVAAGALVVAGALALAWILHAHTLDVLPSINPAPPQDGYGQLVVLTLDHTGRFLREMIGEFGWLDTPSPVGTLVAWYGALGLLVFAAAASARRRQVMVLGLVIAAAVIVPALISASQAHREGYVWQGKDGLPFAVGVPLVAAELVGLSGLLEPVRRRLTGFVAGALALASVAAYVGALRRYAVGIYGPLDFLPGRWRPPLGSVTLVVAGVLAAAAAAVLLTFLAGTRPAPPDANDLAIEPGRMPRGVGSEIASAPGEGERRG